MKLLLINIVEGNKLPAGFRSGEVVKNYFITSLVRTGDEKFLRRLRVNFWLRFTKTGYRV